MFILGHGWEVVRALEEGKREVGPKRSLQCEETRFPAGNEENKEATGLDRGQGGRLRSQERSSRRYVNPKTATEVKRVLLASLPIKGHGGCRVGSKNGKIKFFFVLETSCWGAHKK